MARLVNRRRSAKKSLRKKNMRKSVKHTKRNNRKTRMSHKRHTRKQRGGISRGRVTEECFNKCIEELTGKRPTEGHAVHLPKGVNINECLLPCQPKGDKYIAMKQEILAEMKRNEEKEFDKKNE
jgi:hypothetical protein